ncbi:spore germination protein [Gracilibacillus thailandensis]|uniref:Spore germination protein n=1 Tax=Gracilibacillus thailandensis TaxID=563735 RepID=A0A6N7R4F1_9BACI|nr:spore germination protein [Gracilibacillus thailandensis]MRI68113.1 spore germination protein [Gracilibacillus thailandensis]
MFRRKPKLNKKQNRKLEDLCFQGNLNDDIKIIKDMFGDSSDLVVRFIDSEKERSVAVLYLESLVERESIEEYVISELNENYKQDQNLKELHFATIKKEATSSIKDSLTYLLQGHSLVLGENQTSGIALDTAGGERRQVSESEVETVVRGPRESFNESLQTNIGLVRRRLHTHKLKVHEMKIGELSQTPVAILGIDGVVKPEMYEEVKSRLEKIEIDGILDSLYLEEIIEDPNGYTPFPTIFNSERPDRIAAGLLEGRIAILLEGSPGTLLVPATIGLFLTSNEDYYQRYDFASFLKMLRGFAFFLSVVLPGFYVALLTYHQEMIPTPLLIALTGQREGVPFAIAIEVLFMEITFEILREAGLRLPKTIGAAVSIVGGLVLGQAAVEAGLVGQATVITVSLTAIGSFTTPSYNLAISARLIRFALITLAAVLGAFGLIFGLIFMYIHLTTLRSFGVPYLTPIVPFHKDNWGDLLIRTPWWAMRERPNEVAGENQKRMSDSRDNNHLNRRQKK